jgi:hypothetical protein
VGIERAELIACIEETVAKPDLRIDNKGELMAAVWVAIARLTHFS